MFKQTERPQAGGYMQQLDEWLDENVINKLAAAVESYAVDEDQEKAAADLEPVVEEVKKVLKEKILESYRNGQAAGPRREGKRYAGKR